MPVSRLVLDKGIVFIGMAGVGKSTIGKLLARNLNMAFIDLDVYISEKEGKSPQQIIDETGEDNMLAMEIGYMRNLETKGTVVSPGGSIIYDTPLMDHLKGSSMLVYLYDTFDNISARIPEVDRRAIIGIKTKSLRQIYDERSVLYARYAHITVDCANKSIESIVEEIERKLS
ncbi:MAG TPA: shikimate kinase [Candidatus Acidoferrales bacterium]|nr:shikimate kinase [Candidatus Acidoferrales bacterium]